MDLQVRDSSSNAITFGGASVAYYGLQFNRGDPTASITLSGK